MNIAQHLEKSAQLFPRQPAIIFEGKTTTYEALHTQVCKFAHALSDLDVEPGDRIGLFLANTPAFAIAYYAALTLGAIVVSMNTRSTRLETRFVLEDCAAKVLITAEEFRDKVPAGGLPHLKHIIFAEADSVGQLSMTVLMELTADPVPLIDRDRDDPAVILYTSGTTGTPKGATLSHGNVVSNVWSFVHNCGIRFGERILLQLPLFHCFGQNALMNSAILAGSTLVLQRGFRPDTAIQAIEEQAVTMFFAVPTMFLALLDRASCAQLRSVHYYFSAASSLPEEVERRWHEKFGRVISQGYGLTETSPFASYNHFLKHRFGSIGMPIENVEMKVVDIFSGVELPHGELGEILIKGPNVMIGYWNRPEETLQVLRDGWFHSGDIGRIDQEGYFYIADRLKDMINVGGMNVYPIEVENVLYQHDAVLETAVFGVGDSLMGEQVCAHVVLKPNTVVSAEDLLAFCRHKLADFKVPRLIECVSDLPKNPAGKILKRVLRDQAAVGRNTIGQVSIVRSDHAAATFSHRQLLLDYLKARLAEVLNLETEHIDPDEPIADLGLESLIAVDLAARIRSELGIDFSALVLLNNRTLNGLVDTVAKALDNFGDGQSPV